MKNTSNTWASNGSLILAGALAVLLAACRSTNSGMGSGPDLRQTSSGEGSFGSKSGGEADRSAPMMADLPKIKQPAPAPRSLPHIPPPDANAAQVPAGYRVEVLLSGLQYPSKGQ